ncbi:hypothetical protein MBLNU457_5170t1 [Dothideomycetes sp. NU457]
MLGPIFALLVLSLTATQTTAQQLLVFGSNALPSCAQQCTLLSQAQAACVPPANPVTSQATYESCFCQSQYLTSLRNSPQTVCGDVCSGGDLTQIATWYTNTCADGGTAAAAAASSSATTTSTPTTAPGDADPGSTTTSSGYTQSTAPKEQGWWATHWKWVMMVIIIFVALGLIALIAVLARRRYSRGQDKMKGRFNDGITTRSMTTAQDGGMGQSSYGVDGRATPSSSRQVGGRRDDGPTNLSRIRERDAGRAGFLRGGTADSSRQGTPFSELERDGHRDKGKMRARVEDEEVRE